VADKTEISSSNQQLTDLLSDYQFISARLGALLRLAVNSGHSRRAIQRTTDTEPTLQFRAIAAPLQRHAAVAELRRCDAAAAGAAGLRCRPVSHVTATTNDSKRRKQNVWPPRSGRHDTDLFVHLRLVEARQQTITRTKAKAQITRKKQAADEY